MSNSARQVALDWSGTILRRTPELAPYLGTDQARARFDGPQVFLAPNTAQAVAVTLHELATNAAKYGSLSGWTTMRLNVICVTTPPLESGTSVVGSTLPSKLAYAELFSDAASVEGSRAQTSFSRSLHR